MNALNLGRSFLALVIFLVTAFQAHAVKYECSAKTDMARAKQLDPNAKIEFKTKVIELTSMENYIQALNKNRGQFALGSISLQYAWYTINVKLVERDEHWAGFKEKGPIEFTVSLDRDELVRAEMVQAQSFYKHADHLPLKTKMVASLPLGLSAFRTLPTQDAVIEVDCKQF